jgi:hypothetical protein
MKWAGHIARMAETRNAYRILDGMIEDREQLDNVSVDGRIILE